MKYEHMSIYLLFVICLKAHPLKAIYECRYGWSLIELRDGNKVTRLASV